VDQLQIRIGSRGSDLALWQANYVKDLLIKNGHKVEIIIIKTQGDRIQHLSFDKMEGKGFFTKEIEAALLENSIDLAVHSHKDLETTEPDGLTVAAVPQRADPRDLLLIRKEAFDQNEKVPVKREAIVGTSSARRKSQLRYLRPDIHLKDLRGNVPTRIEKLRSGNYDAILLAKAGLDRLEIELPDLHIHALNPMEFIPAPAQGALGLQIRSNDERLAEVLRSINDKEISKVIGAERAVLRSIHGGCQVPLGVYCEKNGTKYQMRAAFAQQWEGKISHFEAEGTDPDQLAEKISNEIHQLL
jgi:hydroxymethylbilane synthase